MAIAKKNKRKIVVDETRYIWSAKGNDGGISLCVIPEIDGGSKLFCCFDYHQEVKEEFETKYGKGYSLHNQFVVTPYTVRQVINYAKKKGWEPNEKGELNLGRMDDNIDLRFEENKELAIKGKLQP